MSSSNTSPGLLVVAHCYFHSVLPRTFRIQQNEAMPINPATTNAIVLTLTLASPPYGALSNAPFKAPSASPPRSSCLTCCPMLLISSALTGANAGCNVVVSKFEDDSASKASMLIVRQFSARDIFVFGGGVARCGQQACRDPSSLVGRAERGATKIRKALTECLER